MRKLIVLLAALALLGCEPPCPGPPNPAPNPGPAPTPTPPNPNPGPKPNPNPGPTPNPNPEPDNHPNLSITATLSKVIKGDTIQVKTNGTLLPITVKLFGIEAPELGQQDGNRAKEYSTEIIQSTKGALKIEVVGDSTRRHKTGWIILSNGWVLNKEIVRAGWAWEKDSNNAELKELQQAAQTYKYGMWRHTNNQEPWLWRQAHPTSEIDANATDD